MKKNCIVITLVVFFACFLFSCGKAPNTVKVLRRLNNAQANYWADLVKENGVGYIDYDGENIIALALEAKNAELLQAIIKDGADLYRKYQNSKGREEYPLEYVILSTEQDYNQYLQWELAKILIDAGTKLQYTNGLDILLQAWRYGNTELIDLILPGFKKQKLLDYSNYENPEALRIVISDAMFLSWIPTDEKNRDENMISRFNKLAEAGVKLPKDVVVDFFMRFTSPPKNPMAAEYLLKMAGMKASDLDAILSRKKVNYVPVVEAFPFYQKPTGEYNDLIESIKAGGYRFDDDGDYKHDKRFELLELGETFTNWQGITTQWLYVKREGSYNGWILSHNVWEEDKLMFVTTDVVNLRREPNLSSTVQATLPAGTRVKLLSIHEINGGGSLIIYMDTIDGITAPWYFVSYLIPEEDKPAYNPNYNSDSNYIRGYIFSGYLREAEK
jgi:hypothetical protein